MVSPSEREPLDIAEGLLGRFGVVKLWPDIKVAEDEVIARLKITAEALGLECVVIDHLGRTLNPPHLRMTGEDLDFVIHLHFSTPKAYDIFSFVVLWNPLQFYHDFGYRRMSRHLLTHDDFLSCGSPEADDQILRMIAKDPTRLGPHFTMYHSLSEPLLEPTLGDKKLFYIGINWEKLGEVVPRHQKVLAELDMSSKLRIYGPRELRGVRVWEGYESYQGSIPFDGTSIVREINRAGIALVFSSDAHLGAALMSNRLFEAVAGGAVVICDHHPFALQNFGDTLLYVNTTETAEDIADQILRHIRWVEDNPEQAISLARRAQGIFRERYRLDLSLRELYQGLPERRAHLEGLCGGETLPPVALFLLMPEYDAAVLERHLGSARSQNHRECRFILVVDEFDLKHFKLKIEAAIEASDLTVHVRPVRFFIRRNNGRPIRRVWMGSLIAGLMKSDQTAEDFVCFVAPNEEIHANHVRLLAGALAQDPAAGHAHSMLVVRQNSIKGESTSEVLEKLDLLAYTTDAPLGCGRFLFRRSALGCLPDVMLPYLDLLAFAALALHTTGVSVKRAGAIADAENSLTAGENPDEGGDVHENLEKQVAKEREIIRDFDPETFDRVRSEPSQVEHLAPISLNLDKLSRRNLKQLRKRLLLRRPKWRFLKSLLPWRAAKTVWNRLVHNPHASRFLSRISTLR